MAQTILARQDFDERAEVLHAGNGAFVDAANLHAGGHRFDSAERALDRFLVGARNRNRAVLFDVDRNGMILLNAADVLAAGTDEQADLLGIDLGAGQAWRRWRGIRPR